MMLTLLVGYFLHFYLLLSSVKCQFLHDDLQCLDDSVEYQCIVNGAAMAWIVQDTNGTEIMGSISYTSFAIGASQSLGGGLFTVEQIPPLSPITTNISFTVQSSINGYTIICNGGAAGSYNFTVNIPGAPAIPPTSIMVDTFSSSSVHVTWTESSSPCVTGYRYNISSSALEENITLESTSNSVMVEGLVPSDNQYVLVIAAFDTADRSTVDFDACFLFNVPGNVQNLEIYNETGSNDNTIKVIVTWDAPIENTSSCEFYPTLTGYEASITTIVSITLPGPVTLPPTATNYTFDNIPEGVDYTITVIARNGVGTTSASILYEAPGTFIVSSTPSSSSTPSMEPTLTSLNSSTSVLSPSFSTSTSSSSRSATSTIPTTDPTPGPPYIPIIVPVVIILILIIIVIILVIVYCVYRNRDRGSADFMTKASDPIPLKEKHTTRTHQPETGQPTYENPNDAVQHKAAPTGDLYAQPDVKPGSSVRRPPPQPTYQDPSTIQRQQGPTGDMYAMPDRKPANIQVKKPGPGEVYADLDLSTNSPRSPQPLIPSEQQQHQPVLYSDVQHLR